MGKKKVAREKTEHVGLVVKQETLQRGVERTATTTCTPLLKMRVKALKRRLTMMESCKRGVCCACSLSATSRAFSRDAGFFLDSAAGNHTQAPSVSGHTSQPSSSSHEGSHDAILRSCARHGGAATADRGFFSAAVGRRRGCRGIFGQMVQWRLRHVGCGRLVLRIRLGP